MFIGGRPLFYDAMWESGASLLALAGDDPYGSTRRKRDALCEELDHFHCSLVRKRFVRGLACYVVHGNIYSSVICGGRGNGSSRFIKIY